MHPDAGLTCWRAAATVVCDCVHGKQLEARKTTRSSVLSPKRRWLRWRRGSSQFPLQCSSVTFGSPSSGSSQQLAVMRATVTGDRGRHHASIGETDRHVLELRFDIVSCMIYTVSILNVYVQFLQNRLKSLAAAIVGYSL